MSQKNGARGDPSSILSLQHLPLIIPESCCALTQRVSSESSLLPELLHSKLQVLSEAMSKLLTVQLLAVGLPS